MNLEEYRRWLEENGNQEERKAYEVAEWIIKYHLADVKAYDWEEGLLPRFWYTAHDEKLEFDLLIKLKWVNKRKYERWIGIEFKETDFRKVVTQAVARSSYVDYMWVATNMVIPDTATLLELIDYGIGWVIWDDNFVKILIPARYGRGHLVEMFRYLAEREFRNAAERLLNDARVAQGMRSLLEFVK